MPVVSATDREYSVVAARVARVSVLVLIPWILMRDPVPHAEMLKMKEASVLEPSL